MFDHLWINAKLATMREGLGPYGAVADAALGVKDGRIAFAGPMRDLAGPPSTLATAVHDAKGAWITPGLIDCHTHLVFGGDRAREFEARLNGASYEEIAKAGGGILSTVRATQALDADGLFEAARSRLRAFQDEGVTTIEIKSGYGLTLDAEMRQLAAARRLGEGPIRVRTTYLGLHALPADAAGRRADYVAEVCKTFLPAVAQSGLADAVDAFCENIAFTPGEVRQFFEAARALGVPVKLHADQLSDTGGAALAAEHRALSADHLEYTSAEGVAAMARAGTVAVLLPGAFYTLRETRLPPIAAFRAAGVPMAVASDCNPGSSPVRSLLAAMSMAATLFRLTPEETLAGVTRNAARALGLARETGVLAPGFSADFAIWDVAHPAELCYWVGGLSPRAAVAAGRETFTNRV